MELVLLLLPSMAVASLAWLPIINSLSRAPVFVPAAGRRSSGVTRR
jgi:hypothetical protein